MALKELESDLLCLSMHTAMYDNNGEKLVSSGDEKQVIKFKLDDIFSHQQGNKVVLRVSNPERVSNPGTRVGDVEFEEKKFENTEKLGPRRYRKFGYMSTHETGEDNDHSKNHVVKIKELTADSSNLHQV
ncbi:unnamed protein product [Linum trigynum]|uniref:Uncharacterized protein n=1 Tax=Linum trigynum TaxID=586398 RepID=A0AAV2GM70_9ROSI